MRPLSAFLYLLRMCLSKALGQLNTANCLHHILLCLRSLSSSACLCSFLFFALLCFSFHFFLIFCLSLNRINIKCCVQNGCLKDISMPARALLIFDEVYREKGGRKKKERKKCKAKWVFIFLFHSLSLSVCEIKLKQVPLAIELCLLRILVSFLLPPNGLIKLDGGRGATAT